MLSFTSEPTGFAQLIARAESRVTDRLPLPTPVPVVPGARDVDTHGTTVIAVKYKDGVINVADRRATAGYTVMYDQAEKVMALDDHTLISISGSFSKSVEVVRYLRHSFKYFERSQLQPMSLEGKLMELQRVIANNVQPLFQGLGLLSLSCRLSIQKAIRDGSIFMMFWVDSSRLRSMARRAVALPLFEEHLSISCGQKARSVTWIA